MQRVIETYMGRFVDPFDPRPEDILLEDIAHALSMKARYTGHHARFISVAEHSVHVSILASESAALAALLHEGDEVYFPDIASPVKQDPVFDAYRPYAQRMSDCIFRRFNCFESAVNHADEIKTADLIMLAVEADAGMRSYRTSEAWAWVRGFAARHPEMVRRAKSFKLGRLPDQAEHLFLSRFSEVDALIPATEPQVSYIETLAIDIGLECSRRNAWLSDFLGRQVKFVDELSKQEAMRVITRMIEIKEGRD